MTTTTVQNHVQTVPALVASIICASQAERDLVVTCGIQAGKVVEIDLDRVASVSPALAERLADYWLRSVELWDRYAAGETGLDAVDVRRLLRAAAQQDSRQGRRDLVAEVEALCNLSVVGPLIEELLGSNPDFATLEQRGAPVGLTVDTDGDTRTVRFTLPSRRPWAAELGGAASRGEWERTFTLRTSHAAWRDRRNRRLVSIQVHATETWARP